MTVAAGFRFSDGLVLCTDTKHTYSGAMKLQSPKIFRLEYNSGLKTAFCIIGSVRYCKMIVQKCEGALATLAPEETSKAEVKTVIETILLNTFQEHIYKHPDFSRDALSAEFLIGIWSPLDGLGFYSTQDTAINELYGYECLGHGSYLGHYILRPLFVNDLSIEKIVLLATHMLIQTKDYDDSCGGDSQFVWLRNDGTMSDIHHLDISQNESYSKSFETVRKMIFYAVPNLNISEEEFQEQLAAHVSYLEAIRRNLREKKAEYDNFITALTGHVARNLTEQEKRRKTLSEGKDKTISP